MPKKNASFGEKPQKHLCRTCGKEGCKISRIVALKPDGANHYPGQYVRDCEKEAFYKKLEMERI